MHADTLALAKERLRIPELWRLLGLPGEAAKSCRSPLRADDTNPSFSVFDGGLRWKDHGTGEHGDAVDFLARARNLSLKDAIAEFKRLAGVEAATSAAPLRCNLPHPSAKPQVLDWFKCVAAFTPEHQARLAAWRGCSAEFIAWLHARRLVGLYRDEHVAFAIHDTQGSVTACHYRLAESGRWLYFPTGTRIAPLVIGDLATATAIFAFESQWDCFAVAEKLGWHVAFPADTATVVTRGAGNGKLLAGLCAPGITLYAWAQNDELNSTTGLRAGEEWLRAVTAACGCKCLHVVTPAPHKDANDWTRAGATRQDLEAAIAAALPLAQPTAAPPVVSISLSALPECDESESASFPVDALPPAMALLVSAVARCERVPLALPGVCALGVVSAALGAGLEVASGPSRATRGNLFLLASAESGSGKSETFRLVAAPLLEHQQRQLEVWKEKTSPQLQSEIRVLDKEIGTLEKKAAKSSDPMERDRLVGELEYKLARKEDLTRKAAMPCTIAQDVTTERLAVLLRDNREVIFSASADARKLVDNLLGRYNPGKTTDESLYLSGFSGDYIRVDRQGRDSVVLNRPCLALCWFIQPDLLATMLGEESLSASGFLPRLLLCHTQATPRRIEGEAQAISDHTRDQWAQLGTGLLAAFHDAEKPHRITPAPKAAGLLTDFHNHVVDRRAVDLADVGAFAARYAEQAWRLAVVLHAALHGTEAGGQPLTLETAQSAVRLVEWFSAAQLDILAKGRRAAAEKIEEQVLELLAKRERKGQDCITARDVHRAYIVSTPDAARALLHRMEQEGLITGEDVRPAHGGKVTRIYRAVGGRNPVPG